MKYTLLSAFGAAAVLFARGAQAALQDRDLNGDTVVDAFYDTDLDITWLRNANVNGPMNWATAVAWAAGLDVYGVKGWRLPTMIDTGAPGCDFSYAGDTDCGYNMQTRSGGTTDSEMAHLFYVTLGNKAYYAPGTGIGPQPGWGLTNTGNFQNMQSSIYWSGLEYAPYPSGAAWIFMTNEGSQRNGGKDRLAYALAVRPGDVPAVPEPETYALMLAGLAGIAFAAKRRTRTG